VSSGKRFEGDRQAFPSFRKEKKDEINRDHTNQKKRKKGEGIFCLML